MNAIDLLRQQHGEVGALLERARDLKGEEKIQLLGRIAEALTLHATLEERFFYPMLREHGLDEYARSSEAEHAEVKKLVSQLLQAKQTDVSRLDELLERLFDSVRRHVQVEEQTVIPSLYGAVDPRRFDALGREMQDAMSRMQQQELLKMAENPEGVPPPTP